MKEKIAITLERIAHWLRGEEIVICGYCYHYLDNHSDSYLIFDWDK